MRTLHTRRFTIGSAVRCGDGACGLLSQVVIEPIDRVLTHLVVKPEQRGREPRLVALGLVGSAVDQSAPEEIVLHCSLGQFETFERALPAHFLAGASGQWDYRQEQMLSWPHYRLGLDDAATRALAPDRVPLGGIGVRRGDRVQAADGRIGRVQGLVVDRVDRQATHVLLDESHLWDQKRVAIPIGSVIDLKDMTDGVRINLTKDQVRNLPPVELDVQE